MPLFQIEEIEIPPALHYYLISKGWPLIQSLRDYCGSALINFPSLGVVKVCGPTDDVAEAKNWNKFLRIN